MLNIDVLIEDVVANTPDEELSEVIWEYLNNVDYDGDIRELYDDLGYGCPCLVHITQQAFVDMLKRWFAVNDNAIDKGVRGFVQASNGSFYMMHGLNYSWLDADLLGGSGNGDQLEAFNDFCEKSGVRFQFVDMEEL